MKSWLWLAVAALLLATSWASTSPVEPQEPLKLRLLPQTVRYLPLLCRATERTSVIASGTGASPIGLYVYDEHGNCITRDEALVSKTTDDAAVEWYPPSEAIYIVELRNQGMQANEVDVVLR